MYNRLYTWIYYSKCTK